MPNSLIEIFNYRVVYQYLPDFAAGIGTTLWVSAVVLIFGLIIGSIVAICGVSNIPLLRWPISFYIQSIRSTPLLVQIYIVYFALPPPAFVRSTIK